MCKIAAEAGPTTTSKFKAAAEARGLLVTKSEKYGYAHTEPADRLLDFVLENGLTDILITRNELFGFTVPPTTAGTNVGTAVKKTSSRKYVCPCCGTGIRATKEVRILCMECGEQMILESELSNQMKKAG